MREIKNICIYCGAHKGILPQYAEAARQFADAMFAAGVNLVYGGANVGLMGVLADRMLSHGGKVIGVMPKSLISNELAHTELTELHIVDTMSERKKLLFDLSDAFVMLPGGVGTLDEFFEMITLAQIGLHNKPRGILNTANYYDDLLKFLQYSISQNFWNTPNRERVIVNANPEELLAGVLNYAEKPFHRWMDTIPVEA